MHHSVSNSGRPSLPASPPRGQGAAHRGALSHRPPRSKRSWVAVAIIFVASVTAARGAATLAARPGSGTGVSPDDAMVRALVTAEETGLSLSRKLRLLSASLLDLDLPGPSTEARSVFAPSVTLVDVLPPPSQATNTPPLFQPTPQPWPIESASRQVTQVDIWRPLLNGVSFFEHARFSLIRGEHPGGDLMRYVATAAFDATAFSTTGGWQVYHGRVKLDWSRPGNPQGETGEWQITGWWTEEMQWTRSPGKFFAETLETALPSPQEVERLRHSAHYDAVVKYYREGMKNLPHPYFAPISVNQKEGLAVADVNGDGFDDIHISVRLGKNLLLLNRGDGTFTEEGARFHLDLPGHTTCSIFADFDNDGDLDAMLGRSLLKTSYLENRGGVYYQHPIPPYMPMAVISMSAADYNNDGLLDVYLCTYRPAAPAGSGMTGGYAQAAKEGDFDWPDEFFPPDLAREFRRRVAEHRQRHGASVLDQLGPPNVLLVNRGGGRFEPAPENATVGLWRNSLQATWCDYNDDGRPDLYIPNDWGLNALFRNDGPSGFTEVTSDLGLTVYGFSMGASFGDYDNDGRDDLYVSNMHSEAGLRITDRLPEADTLFTQSASGNFLYHREADGRFRQVAGPAPPALTVARAGWSWGGCFRDFDNDGFLDLYVLNGYFSAPSELASGVDLESNLWRTMVRADANLSRPTFRFSPEWRRTPPPDRLGPHIDARLVGVERHGDQILVHSLHGQERNRFFFNQAGRAFSDLSGLSGLDLPKDSRGFAALDYDRDGWLDVAVVNANQPLFNLFRNEMPAAGLKGGVIALRFVGGNKTSRPSSEYTCRDGYGARVTVQLGSQRIVRDHRCGEGWSTQNSATMVVGIGRHATVDSVVVRWPSGRSVSTQQVPEGTLLTVFENPAESESGESFTRGTYRVPQLKNPRARPMGPVFAVRSLDSKAKPARLRVYSTFATAHPSSMRDLPTWRRLVGELGDDGVDLAAVPVDPADDDPRLGAFARQWNPALRLVHVPADKRTEAIQAFASAVGQRVSLPITVVTDGAGHLLAAHEGPPNLSGLRALLQGLR